MRRTPTLAFLLVTVFIDMLGLGLIVPIVPNLMIAIGGHAGGAARWSGVIDASFGLAQFLVAPLLGRLSDRYGRKPVLVTALAFLGVDYLGHAVASSMWLILVAHTIAGAFAGTGTVVNAYIADITEPSGRPRAYGSIGAAFSIGFVAGPALGGLLGAVDVRLPFYAAAALAFGNAAYGALVVPESRPGDHRTSLSWRVANPVAALAAMVRRPGLGRLAVARLLNDISRVVNQVSWVFVLIVRFGWTSTRVGLLLALSSVVGAIVSARVAGPFVNRLGERGAAVVCALCGAASLTGYAVLRPGWWLAAPMVLGAVASIGASATQSWITDLTADDEHGTIQGAVTGIASMAEMVVPLGATAVFAWSLTVAWPGLVLVVGAAFAVAAAVVMAGAPRRTPVPVPA